MLTLLIKHSSWIHWKGIFTSCEKPKTTFAVFPKWYHWCVYWHFWKKIDVLRLQLQMMMSSNGNSFHVTRPLCMEFIGHRQIPLTKAIELWCFLWSAPEQTVEQIIETSVIWDIIALIMMLLSWSDYTFDVVSQSNSTTQIAEQRQIVINRYLSRHCRGRNQRSSWHRMADVRFDNQNSVLSTSLPYRLPYRHGILLPISKRYQNGNVMSDLLIWIFDIYLT